MKSRLKNSIFLSHLYVGLIILLMWTLNRIIPFKKNQLVFASFSGRQFSDSPRAIYESIKGTDFYHEVKCVWAFEDPSEFPEVADQKVAINSFRFFLILATSRFWIANSSIERMVPYKPKGVYYINTWHGFPWKVLGDKEPNIDFLMKNWYKKVSFDVLTACGTKDKAIFESVFPSTEPQNIYPIGLPRNDKVVNFLKLSDKNKKQIRSEIKRKLHLSVDKMVILYAPTFRDGSYERNSYLDFKADWWNSIFKDFEVLNRSHYNVREDLSTLGSVVDVSNYSDLADLFFISDLLITDYSSIMFDFALMEKPIFLYTGDFEKYKRERGMYFSRQELGLPFEETDQGLAEEIGNLSNYNIECVHEFNSCVNDRSLISTQFIVSTIKRVLYAG
ncbi:MULTISPECIES: CDP-glycerol glycerophosphotransferase family protein [Levilactobacillus]|uniref:CDP-glycerol glycerophosphotransferase family protein n=1 Tax=Levilactobacillus TaxID=2767886 RepID=UPI0021A84C83|nr:MULTISPECIES: CDP-glycerol glycerophosphotransferase family protein [Levilactobacillus]MCT3584275.1 CDP-glycerol--glycerophosphate glycerophosphotransferase [Levilactobacillus brevis]MCT4491345.1 CDP-glycerol--glycerophosphate glycerophosphotransferase [Levilactobacillus parabrevis]